MVTQAIWNKHYRLSQLVEQQSINLPAGLLSNQLEQANVRFNQKSTSEQQFKDLVIKSCESGTLLQLGDIAEIQQQFTLEEDKILFNGERAALLELSKNYNQDSLKVRNAIQTLLEREQQMAPEGLFLTVTQDVSVNIKERLRINHQWITRAHISFPRDVGIFQYSL